jgi:hypothetical protein
MQAAGITSEAIAGILQQGMLGELSAAQVGEQLADVVIGGIYNTIASGPATMIADAFTQQIITPLLTAALAGAPVAGVVSQAAIDGVMRTAANAMNTLNQVLNDPGFRSAIDQLYGTIRGLATVSTSSAGSIKKYRSSVSSSGAAASTAADQIKSAFESIVDNISDEIDRLRANILGNTSEGAKSYYESQFAILTAQARAGDQDAGKKLAEVSQALEKIAESSALSLSDLNVTRATLAQSLAQTRAILGGRYGISVPAFDVGTNYVPHDMLAMVHKGEAIVPAAYNPAADTGALLAELRAMRAELAAVRANTGATATTLDDSATGRRPLKQKVV